MVRLFFACLYVALAWSTVDAQPRNLSNMIPTQAIGWEGGPTGMSRVDATTGLFTGTLNVTGNINGASPTEMGYLSGVTSAIQTQLDATGDALTSNPLSQFAATTSAELAGVLSDETGTGALVFSDSPTFTTQITTPMINVSADTVLARDAAGVLALGGETDTDPGTLRVYGNKTVGDDSYMSITGDTISTAGDAAGDLTLDATGNIEIDAVTQHRDDANFYNNIGVNTGKRMSIFGSYPWFYLSDGFSNRTTFLLKSTNYSFVVGGQHAGKSWDTTATTPTVFVFSAGDPDVDNTQYTSITHDGTDGVIGTGSGGLTLSPAGADGAKLDNSSTAGNTRFLIYDVDNGTLERVTVGAADSGGSGYKVLRIPN